MKQKIILAILIAGALTTAACKKQNEVPPKQQGYYNLYTLPAPTFLTPEERAILDAKREEWDNL